MRSLDDPNHAIDPTPYDRDEPIKPIVYDAAPSVLMATPSVLMATPSVVVTTPPTLTRRADSYDVGPYRVPDPEIERAARELGWTPGECGAAEWLVARVRRLLLDAHGARQGGGIDAGVRLNERLAAEAEPLRAEIARLTAERDEAQAEAHDRMESALYDALGEPPEAEREAAHDRILSRCGSAADVEISGAGPSWEGLLARVRALRAERDRLAAERTEATRAHYRDLLIVHRTLDEGSNETDLDYALQGIQRLQIERDGLREDVARLTAERDAYASFAHEIAALVVSDGAIDTLRHLGPSDLDHLGEVVRARLAGGGTP